MSSNDLNEGRSEEAFAAALEKEKRTYLEVLQKYSLDELIDLVLSQKESEGIVIIDGGKESCITYLYEMAYGESPVVMEVKPAVIPEDRLDDLLELINETLKEKCESYCLDDSLDRVRTTHILVKALRRWA